MERWRTVVFSKFILRRVSFTGKSCYMHTLINAHTVNHTQTLVFTNEKKKNSVSDLLSNYGFSKGQIKHLQNTSQSFAALSEKQLSKNLLHWHTHFAKDRLFSVLTGNPELLSLTPSDVSSRVKELMGVFTKKDISKLLLTCPKVFTEDFAEIMGKVQYIVHDMGVQQCSIVKAGALRFGLNHIQCRHSLLCRSGYFKKSKRLKSKNAPLDKIFSKNIAKFLKLTQLTEEEFLVFNDMFEEEQLELKELCEDLEEEENEDEELINSME